MVKESTVSMSGILRERSIFQTYAFYVLLTPWGEQFTNSLIRVLFASPVLVQVLHLNLTLSLPMCLSLSGNLLDFPRLDTGDQGLMFLHA